MAKDLKYGNVTLERGTIGEDEPVVVFRAQDSLLPELLENYIHMCKREGSPERHINKIIAAQSFVQEWQENNSVKIPTSDPHLPKEF